MRFTAVRNELHPYNTFFYNSNSLTTRYTANTFFKRLTSQFSFYSKKERYTLSIFLTNSAISHYPCERCFENNIIKKYEHAQFPLCICLLKITYIRAIYKIYKIKCNRFCSCLEFYKKRHG